MPQLTVVGATAQSSPKATRGRGNCADYDGEGIRPLLIHLAAVVFDTAHAFAAGRTVIITVVRVDS